MANNLYGAMLNRPAQAYTRQSGVASGLGQKQPQTCPTGYQWNRMQGKCVAVNTPKQGFWNQVSTAVPPPRTAQQSTQSYAPTRPMTQAGQGKPVFTPQYMPKKLDHLSPYAQLLASAVDLTPPLTAVPQAYPQLEGGSNPAYMQAYPEHTTQQASPEFMASIAPQRPMTQMTSNNVGMQLNPMNDRFRKLVMGR